MRHPEGRSLLEFVHGRAEPATTEHMANCRACRRTAALCRALGTSQAALTPAATAACPAAEDLIRHIDTGQALSSAASAHLALCFGCAVLVERCSRFEADRTRPPVLRPDRRPSLFERLRALVQIEMPEPVAFATRGRRGPAPSAEFSLAMTDYQAGHYTTASDRLWRARESGDCSAGLNLYLGACLLRLERTPDAIDVLSDAVRERPRLAEFRWYLAQALLLEGDYDGAIQQLRRASALNGPYRIKARRLNAEVRAVHESSAPQTNHESKRRSTKQ